MRSKIAIILAAAMMVSGCATKPRLPDPTFEYPAPPAALMEPARKMETIPVVSK